MFMFFLINFPIAFTMTSLESASVTFEASFFDVDFFGAANFFGADFFNAAFFNAAFFENNVFEFEFLHLLSNTILDIFLIIFL